VTVTSIIRKWTRNWYGQIVLINQTNYVTSRFRNTYFYLMMLFSRLSQSMSVTILTKLPPSILRDVHSLFVFSFHWFLLDLTIVLVIDFFQSLPRFPSQAHLNFKIWLSLYPWHRSSRLSCTVWKDMCSIHRGHHFLVSAVVFRHVWDQLRACHWLFE
jgi:hypothetical protein